jgi:hypothetical protein
MALRLAVAAFAALRAVLIYGEAAQLTTRPVRVPRLTFTRTRRTAPVAKPLT